PEVLAPLIWESAMKLIMPTRLGKSMGLRAPSERRRWAYGISQGPQTDMVGRWTPRRRRLAAGAGTTGGAVRSRPGPARRPSAGGGAWGKAPLRRQIPQCGERGDPLLRSASDVLWWGLCRGGSSL